MPSIHLTDRKLRSLSTNRSQTDFWDENLPGFGVRVTRKGRKSFVLMYRSRGRKSRLTLGTYPALGLADARDRAKVMLFDVARGRDPQAERRAARRAPTFEDLSAEYIERHAKRNKKSWKEDQRKLTKDLLPYWSRHKAADITRRDVVEILERILKRGSPVAANRTLALISRIFNFGIDEELVESNPAQRVRKVAKERPRDRVLNEAEIRTLWRTLDQMEPIIAATFRLRLLTAQRGIEVLSMRWSDLAEGWWTIPGDVAKNSLTHRVPLSPQSLAVLTQLQPLTGGCEWVFDSPKKPGTHITAVRKVAVRLNEASGISFTPHDLRRTAASHMTGLGIPRLVVSKILNHVESGITAVYDRHSYDHEKRHALDQWGERVEDILYGRQRYSPADTWGAPAGRLPGPTPSVLYLPPVPAFDPHPGLRDQPPSPRPLMAPLELQRMEEPKIVTRGVERRSGSAR